MLMFSVVSASNIDKNSTISKKDIKSQEIKHIQKNNIKSAQSKTKTNIKIQNINKKYELNDKIQVKTILTDKKGKKLSNQKLSVKVDKKSYNIKTNNQGIALTNNITIKTLGKHKVEVRYSGNNNYYSSKTQTTFTSTKIATKIYTQKNLEYCNYETADIPFSLTNKNGKTIKINDKVNVKINDKTFKTSIKNGKITLNYNNQKLNNFNLNEGNNSLKLIFNGNNKYKKATFKTKLIVGNRLNTNLKFEPIKVFDNKTKVWKSSKISVGDLIKVTPYLENSFGEKIEDGYNIKVNINNDTFITDSTNILDDENFWKYEIYGRSWYISEYNHINTGYSYSSTGKPIRYRSIYYHVKNAGLNNISLQFDGDEIFTPSKTINNFTALKTKLYANLTLFEKNNLKENMYIKAQLKYSNNYEPTGENVKFTINKKTYNLKTDNGTAILKFKPTKTGKYNIKMIVLSNSSKKIVYNNCHQNFTVGKNLVKKETRINVSCNEYVLKNHYQELIFNVTYKPNQYIDSWKLVPKGTKINITINNKSKVISINRLNQEYSFNSTKLKTNNVTLKYLGNTLFKSSKNQINFTCLKNCSVYMDIDYYMDIFNGTNWNSVSPFEDYLENVEDNLIKLKKIDFLLSTLDEIEINEGFVELKINNKSIGKSNVKNNFARLNYSYDESDNKNAEIQNLEIIYHLNGLEYKTVFFPHQRNSFYYYFSSDEIKQYHLSENEYILINSQLNGGFEVCGSKYSVRIKSPFTMSKKISNITVLFDGKIIKHKLNKEYGNYYIKFNVPENMLYEGIHNLSILHSFYNKTVTVDYQFYYRNTDYIIIS